MDKSMNLRRLDLTWVMIIVTVTGLLISCGHSQPEAGTVVIPLNILFGVGDITIPQLSPDGRTLAYRAARNEVMNIYVRDVGSAEGRFVTADSLSGIQRFQWAGNSRTILFLRDADSKGNLRLYDVNLQTGEIRDLTPFENIQVQILKVHPSHPDTILICMNLDKPGVYNVYRLDLVSGNFQLAAENPGTVVGWLADSDLNIKGCLQLSGKTDFDFMVAGAAGWQPVIRWTSEEITSSNPIEFSPDGRHVYALDSRNANTSRLVKVEAATGAVEVIYEDSIYSVSGVMFHPVSKEVQAVIMDRDREETVIKDESIRGDMETIAKLHHGDYFISSRDEKDETWLIGFNNDRGPVPYYLYDRNTKKATFLFEHYPELKEYQLAAREPVVFKARDGLQIHGYISFPLGREKSNLPLVVYVHEGPWQRDSWGYDAEAQWLTNRGYVCLQINYRGSSGYGKKFLAAGDRQWGRAMLDDIVDGVNWVVGQGYADPRRVGVIGWRFGGYMALMAAIRYPDVFACAVDVSGYIDLVTMLKSIPASYQRQRELFYTRVGSPLSDSAMLAAVSPISYTDSIAVPLMIVQGERDPLVSQASVNAISESLRSRGIDVEYMLFADEGHGLTLSLNRILFYEKAEEFLKRHLSASIPETAGATK